MGRRWARLLLFVIAAIVIVGPASAQASVPHASTTRVVTDAGDGIDPAERGAVNGTLGYHERRWYPYATLIFLAAMTPIALVLITRHAPKTGGDTR